MVHGCKCRLSVLLSHDFELANIDVNLKTVMAEGATHASTYSIYLINGIFVMTLYSTWTRESPDPSPCVMLKAICARVGRVCLGSSFIILPRKNGDVMLCLTDYYT